MALASLELREQLPGMGDLSLLSLLLGFGTFVVASEKQHNPVAMEVHEDPKQDFLPGPTGIWLVEAEHPRNLV